MPDANLFALLKDLAPSSVAVIGIVLISHYLIKAIQVFADRYMKFMDRLIEILDKHSNVISGITAEIRSHSETISNHGTLLKQAVHSMETTSRIMERFSKSE